MWREKVLFEQSKFFARPKVPGKIFFLQKWLPSFSIEKKEAKFIECERFDLFLDIVAKNGSLKRVKFASIAIKFNNATFCNLLRAGTIKLCG